MESCIQQLAPWHSIYCQHSNHFWPCCLRQMPVLIRSRNEKRGRLPLSSKDHKTVTVHIQRHMRTTSATLFNIYDMKDHQPIQEFALHLWYCLQEVVVRGSGSTGAPQSVHTRWWRHFLEQGCVCNRLTYRISRCNFLLQGKKPVPSWWRGGTCHFIWNLVYQAKPTGKMLKKLVILVKEHQQPTPSFIV